MQDSARYFQLTPEILVEYNYNNLSGVYDQAGDVSDRIVDFENDAFVVDDKYNNHRWFYEYGTFPPSDENNFSEGECHFEKKKETTSDNRHSALVCD